MEEDIKILEFLKDSEIWFPLQNVKKPMFSERQKQALENLLTRYKQLEEENKTQLEAFELGKESSRKRIEYDYIPKSKVKEKIEEIKLSLKDDCLALHEFQRLAKIDVLEELLREE